MQRRATSEPPAPSAAASTHVTTTTTTTASSATTLGTKKKFGKNLNKLVKPSAPPIVHTSHAAGSARNGLLLLSTKKPKESAGLLAARTPTTRTASTHEVLRSAVHGASLEPTAPTEVWKLPPPPPPEEPNETLIPPPATLDPEPPSPPPPPPPPPSTDTDTKNLHVFTHIAPSWDEYGGRHMEGSSATAKTPATTSPRTLTARPTLPPPSQETRRQLWQPDSQTRSTGGATTPTTTDSWRHAQPQPVVHVASYEDGYRNETVQPHQPPRMLFDPKSGAMVAVSTTNGGAPQPTRRKKEGTHANKTATVTVTKKNARRMENGKSKTAAKDGDAKSQRPAETTWNGAMDAAAGPQNTRREVGAVRNSHVGGQAETKGDVGKTSTTTENAQRRFPRTCGVLYSRDAKGNLFSVDGCDGDLGYGMHSVPGGRVKNVDAFTEYNRQVALSHSQPSSQPAYGYKSNNRYDMESNTEEYGTTTNFSGREAEVPLYTGLSTGNNEFVPEPLEYVRADDKLELVTGMEEDTPTLKPTAREWAPSQAALAAAAARSLETKMEARAEGLNDSYHEDHNEEEDDDDDGPLGLGFDPTQDMDFVIESPSHERSGTSRLDLITMSALSLEPSVYQSKENDRIKGTGAPRHLFAFGTSGTWGADPDHVAAGAGEWELPPTSDTSRLLGGKIFQLPQDDQVDSTAAFINIASGNSWPTPPLGSGGLSNTPAGVE